METAASVEFDMGLVKAKSTGNSSVVFNTERESDDLLRAVSSGLGAGWKRVLNNECTIAYDSDWHQAPGYSDPVALLLAKADPSMAGVSPKRYLDKAYLENDKALGTVVGMFGTHLVSEANCIHVNVKGRAWRERTYKIQIADVLDEVERVVNLGVPVVLAGDFNTGIYFTGKALFALLTKRFGARVIHVHNGGLDQIFAIGAGNIRLSEVGVEVETNNKSDHNAVTAIIRAELVA